MPSDSTWKIVVGGRMVGVTSEPRVLQAYDLDDHRRRSRRRPPRWFIDIDTVLTPVEFKNLFQVDEVFQVYRGVDLVLRDARSCGPARLTLTPLDDSVVVHEGVSLFTDEAPELG